MKRLGKIILFAAAFFCAAFISGHIVRADIGIMLDVVDGTDISNELRNAFNEARVYATAENPYVITIPAGTYYLSKGCDIFSNTTLMAKDVTLKHPDTGDASNFIRTETQSPDFYENITIAGGTYIGRNDVVAGLMRFQHVTNLTLEGCEFVGGGGGHQVEVGGIDTMNVRDCTFRDFSPKQIPTASYEALQFDIPCNSSIFGSGYLDGISNRNITVEGCNFRNLPRALGTHGHLDGSYMENMKIVNNTFKDIVEMAIITTDYYNCIIERNEIIDCGQGIVVSHARENADAMFFSAFDGAQPVVSPEYKKDLKTVIRNNTIKIKYVFNRNRVDKDGSGKIVSDYIPTTVAIRVSGVNWSEPREEVTKGGDGIEIPMVNYYIAGVSVYDNTITTEGNGIQLMNARSCKVYNNKVDGVAKTDGVYSFANSVTGKIEELPDENKRFVGIRVSDKSNGISLLENETLSSEESIPANKISGMSDNGIYFMEGSSALSIRYQEVKNCKGTGIEFAAGSICRGNISNNVVEKCSDGGIYLSSGSKACDIKYNTLTGIEGKSAIFINEASCGRICNNTIRDSGIYSVNEDGDNVVPKEENYVGGIRVANKSVCEAVESNIIEAVNTTVSCGRGIEIAAESRLAGNICDNRISDCKFMAIRISGKSAGADITGNEINKKKAVASAGRGIDINDSVVANINNNKLYYVKGAGIYISSGKVTNEIAENTIDSCTEGGIYSNYAGVINLVRGNVLNKISGMAAIFANGATMTTIKENIIRDCGVDANKSYVGAIRIANAGAASANITSNTIEAVNTTVSCGRGIEIAAGAKLTGSILSNKIYDCKDMAIRVSDKAVCANITSNEITKKKAAASSIRGIDVNKSTVTNINSNKVYYVKGTGIYVSGGNITGEIAKNSIATCTDGGIYANSSGVIKQIRGNVLNKISGKAAIFANGATMTTIRDNIIRDCGVDANKSYVGAIRIANAGAASANITSNTIEAVNTTVSCGRGIEIAAGAKLTGSILSNKIYDCKDMAIRVSDKAVCANITSNEITKKKAAASSIRGIDVNKSTVTNINSNKVYYVKGTGIYVSGGNITGEIAKNSIAVCTEGGIYANSLGVIKQIRGNVLNKISGMAAIFANGATMTTIRDNIIRDCGKAADKSYVGAIRIANSSTCGNIYSNTIEGNATTVSCGRGIEIANKSKLTGSINLNKLSDCTDSAIRVSAGAVCGNITNNTVTKKKTSRSALRGVDIADSTVKNVTGNTLYYCRGTGLWVSNGKVNGTIGSNYIAACLDGGIYVNDKAVVNSVDKNLLFNIAGRAAIFANTATIYTISNNTIRDLKQDANKLYVGAIRLSYGSQCNNITGNTITVKGTKVSAGRGIEISNKSKVNGSIQSNKIYYTKYQGIYISGGSTVTKYILGNSIAGAKDIAIYIDTVSNNLVIQSNKIANTASHGIYIGKGNGTRKFIIRKNSITMNKLSDAVWMMSGIIDINGNAFASAKRAIRLEKTMAGTIDTNVYKGCTVMVYAGKNINIPATAISAIKAGKGSLTVANKAVAGVSGYEYNLATNKAFTLNAVKPVSKARALAVKKLLSKKTYYVRTRAYVNVGKIKIYGSYSPVKKAVTL